MQSVTTNDASVALALQSAAFTAAKQDGVDGISFYKEEIALARAGIAAYLGQGLATVYPATLFLFHTTPKTIGQSPNPFHVSSEKQLLALVDAEKVKQANSHAMDLFRAAKGLALHFMVKGLPEGVSTANDTPHAVRLLSEYFTGLGVSSVAKLNAWVEAEQSETETFDASKVTTAKPIAERVARAVKTAKRKKEFSVVDARNLATQAMANMSFAEMSAFATATATAYAEKAEIRRLHLEAKAAKATEAAAAVAA